MNNKLKMFNVSEIIDDIIINNINLVFISGSNYQYFTNNIDDLKIIFKNYHDKIIFKNKELININLSKELMLLPNDNVHYYAISVFTEIQKFISENKICIISTNSDIFIDTIRLELSKITSKIKTCHYFIEKEYYKINIDNNGKYVDPPEEFRKFDIHFAMSLLEL